MKFWAILGSQGCREKTSKLPKVCNFSGWFFQFFVGKKKFKRGSLLGNEEHRLGGDSPIFEIKYSDLEQRSIFFIKINPVLCQDEIRVEQGVKTSKKTQKSIASNHFPYNSIFVLGACAGCCFTKNAFKNSFLSLFIFFFFIWLLILCDSFFLTPVGRIAQNPFYEGFFEVFTPYSTLISS